MTARARLPDRRGHEVFVVEHLGMKFTAGVGRYADGNLAEVFISTSKLGTGVDVVLRDSSILLSLLLQHGCPVEIVCHALVKNADGSPAGPIGKVLGLIEGMPPRRGKGGRP
jgi:hypothetical protein